MGRVLALFLAVTAVVAAGAALACECPFWRSATDQLSFSDVAFVGIPVSTLPERGPGGLDGNLVTEFRVTRTLRGPHQAIRRIAHYPGPVGATCGIDFSRGREVLVLAGSRDGRLYTGACQRPRFPLADFERAARR